MDNKTLKFLVDAGVGKKVEILLRELGYDVRGVRDLNASMLDREILGLAGAENRLVITMDKDFGELIYNSGLPHGGVLLLRLEGSSSEQKATAVRKIIEMHLGRLRNSFSVYKNGKLRIRQGLEQ